MLNQRTDDVFSFLKRVMVCLSGFLGPAKHLDIVPRVGLDDADVDCVAEDAGCERPDVLYRRPTEFLRKGREEQLPMCVL